MKKLTNTLMRGLVALTMAGFAIAATPGIAQAEILNLAVDEGEVPGANDLQVDATGLTGKYLENLDLDFVTGEFTATLVVQFTAYTETVPNPGVPPPTEIVVPVQSQIGAIVGGAGETTNTNLYGLYALVSVEGTFIPTDPLVGQPGAGTLTQFIFSPVTAFADIYTDPSRDTVFDYTGPTATDANGDDQHILTASLIAGFPQSNGFTTIINATQQVVGGSYALVFTNPALVDPDGPLYWPGLTGFTLTGTASGDVDPASECPSCEFPVSVVGDTSISFQGEQIVPEPATLSLLGIGLLAAAAAARRRRKA